jgi:phosphoribosylformylglycinamidine cyclo-ligase
VPAIFGHLQRLGALEDETMLRSFNMGVGLVAVVPAELLKKAKLVLTRMNERSMVIGRVVKRAVGRVGYV